MQKLLRLQLQSIDHPIFGDRYRGPLTIVAEYAEPSFPSHVVIPTTGFLQIYGSPSDEYIGLAYDVRRLADGYNGGRNQFVIPVSEVPSLFADEPPNVDERIFPWLASNRVYVAGLASFAPPVRSIFGSARIRNAAGDDFCDPAGGSTIRGGRHVVIGRPDGLPGVGVIVLGRPFYVWPHIVAVIVPVINRQPVSLGADRMAGAVADSALYTVQYIDVSKPAKFDIDVGGRTVGCVETVYELPSSVAWNVLESRLLACTAASFEKERLAFRKRALPVSATTQKRRIVVRKKKRRTK